MSKKILQAQYNAVKAAKAALDSKIEQLEEAKKTLSGISTTVAYVLESHEHIKETYHLAGTRYLKMTGHEEDILTDFDNKVDPKKKDVISQLETKIASLGVESGVLGAEMFGLNILIALATD